MKIHIKVYNSDNIKNEYIIQLCKLVEICFGYKENKKEFKEFIKTNIYVLIAFDSNKIIGSSYINEETVYKVDKKKLDPYVLKKRFSNNYYFLIKNKIELFPMLNGFCRNPDNKYKGLGQKMLNELYKLCKRHKYKRLYCIPESTKGLINSQKDDEYCGIGDDYDNKNNDYYKKNMNLVKYYKKIGFKMFKNHFDIDFCSTSNNESDYIALNVLYINIK